MQKGYLVGSQCFSSETDATNYKMSQIAPAITSDGRLITPVFQNDQWTFSDEQVSLTFPECDNREYFNDGMQAASMIVVAMVVAYIVRIIIKMIYSMSDNQGVNNE